MKDITFTEFINFYYDLIDSIDEDMKKKIFLCFHHFIVHDSLFYNTGNKDYYFIIIDNIKNFNENRELNREYEKNRAELFFSDINNLKISHENFFNILVFIDEKYTHYDNKDEYEYKKTNEFLYIYREKIRKYL